MSFQNGNYQEITEKKQVYIQQFTNTSIYLPLSCVLIFVNPSFVSWNITSSSLAEFNLVNEPNYKYLQYNTLFLSYWSLKNATHTSFQIDTSKIGQKLYLCVVNRNPYPIYTNFYVIQTFPITSLIEPILILILIFIFVGGVSLLCCIYCLEVIFCKREKYSLYNGDYSYYPLDTFDTHFSMDVSDPQE